MDAFNPLDEAFRREPWPLYARARREQPVWVHEPLNAVSIFRYDDVLSVLRDAGSFSNFQIRGALRAAVPDMLSSDPPEHTRLRGLVNQAFTPRVIRRLEPRLREVAHELLDDALARRSVDLVEALTSPLPVIAIAEILGVPAEDRAQFKRWSDEVIAGAGTGLVGAPPSEARLAAMERRRADMNAYFSRLVDERRRATREDLLSGLVAAELEGSRLSFDEMMSMLTLLLIAGNETTTNLIGSSVVELLAHRDALAALRADPSRVPDAIEEVLRCSGPVQMDPRRVTRDVEVGGVKIRAGQMVMSWLGSANRDEAVFEQSERFDIARRPNRHLSFGFGVHYCIGANLARLEAQVALETLLARTRSFERSDDAPLPLHPSFIFRGPQRLPVELVAA